MGYMGSSMAHGEQHGAWGAGCNAGGKGATWRMGARTYGAEFGLEGAGASKRCLVSFVHIARNETGLPEHAFRAPGVPKFSPNCFDSPVVDDADIERRLVTGALESLMPLTADLGLVMEKDGVPVSL